MRKVAGNLQSPGGFYDLVLHGMVEYGGVSEDILAHLASPEVEAYYKESSYEELLGQAVNCIESVLKDPELDGSFFPGGETRWSHRAELVEAAACIVAAIRRRD